MAVNAQCGQLFLKSTARAAPHNTGQWFARKLQTIIYIC